MQNLIGDVMHRIHEEERGTTAVVTTARRSRRFRGTFHVVAAVIGLAVSSLASAANYPLELVQPRAVNTSPATGFPVITSTHRVFRAYPGLEYNVRAAVVGGAYPYTFTLTGGPSGMTIDSRTGLVTWPNPQTTSSATLTVRDSEGTQVSSTWTINVTTSDFHFVDANCTTCGQGTAAAPFRTISQMMNSSATGPGDFVIFRRGTYNVLDMPRDSVGTGWERVEIAGSEKPVVWLAYPGEMPIIDFGYARNGVQVPLIRFTGANVYVDGFETMRSRIIGFQTTSGPPDNYRTFRRLRMHTNSEPGANNDGSNAALIMTTQNYHNESRYMTIQDNEFYDVPVDLAIKTYSLIKVLIEDNVFHDMLTAIELKADVPQFTVRANTFYNIGQDAIAGNMDEGVTSGEINFNLIRSPVRWAVDINQNGTARRIDIYRNTIKGRIRVRNTDAADGPFNFYDNVILNDDSGTPSGSKILHESVSAPARVTTRDNLVGPLNSTIIDTIGLLTSQYSQYLGLRGHQIGNIVRPNPPTGVAVQ
jgi:hypothetical protein